MTLEKAAELVSKLSGDAKIDLFDHFATYFNLRGADVLENFASMCGFLIATNISKVD